MGEVGNLRRWSVVLLLAVAFAVSILDRSVLNLLIEPVKRDLAISDTQVGLVAGIGFALFYAAFGLVGGRLADRYRRRTIIVAGILLWSAATASTGFAGSFTQLLLCRAAVAVGEATLSPAAFSMIADLFPRERLGRAVSVYYLGGTLGPGLALLAGGGLVALAGDLPPGVLDGFPVWQRVMILAGLPGLVVAALIRVFVREPVRRDDKNASAAVGDGPPPALLPHLRRNWRAYAPIFAGMTLSSIYVNGLLTWGPAFFLRVYQWTPAETARLLGTLFAIAGTLGALTGGVLSDALRRRFPDGPLLAMTGMCLIATPTAILATRVEHDGGLALGLLAVVFFGVASFNAIAPSAIQLITPNRLRGRTSALYLMLVSIVAVGGGPLLVGLSNDLLFGDPRAVGRSLSLVAIAVLPATLAIFVAGRRAYRKVARIS